MKPRLAASHYLNSAPLIWSFLHGEDSGQVELIDAVPARCAELLEANEVDVALVPVIEYQRIPNLRVVPDVCVGSHERVRSVLLVSRSPGLDDVRSVALDESSRTSATLIKILFKEFIGTEPRWNPSSPNLAAMLDNNDAALIIGDPAMTFAQGDLHIFDLAALWHEHTGLGFVFAMWMSVPGRDISTKFRMVRDRGLEKIEEIVGEYSRVIPLPRSELREYLTENISYTVDESLRAGLNRYFELAYKHSLIEQLLPLSFTPT